MTQTNRQSSRIYTKKGDQGQTQLIGGCLVSKADLRIDSYGSVDELNSYIGRAKLIAENQNIPKLNSISMQLEKIQNELFCIGSLLACEDENLIDKLPKVPTESVALIENAIDQMTSELPVLREFILPGGTELACWLHICRTQCRRAERNSVKLFDHLRSINPEPEKQKLIQTMAETVIYLNRLSDYFFTAARFANFLAHKSDQPWQKP